jgi:hypothetical protein
VEGLRLRTQTDPFVTMTALDETEIKSGKHSDTRINCPCEGNPNDYPYCLMNPRSEVRPGNLVVCDWTIDVIQHTTHALDFTATIIICPMAAGGASAVPKKQERSLTVGVRAIEKKQGKRDNPREPEAQAARGNTSIYNTMQERCRTVGRRFISGQFPSKSMGTARPLSLFYSPAFVTPLRK